MRRRASVARRPHQGVPRMADNHVTLMGNLTSDPELRFTGGGIPVGSFRLAVSTRQPDGTGGWKDGEPSFFRVNVWRDQAEHVIESLCKGDRVIVTGRLKLRTWQAAEGNRSVVEVEADEVGTSLRWACARPQ